MLPAMQWNPTQYGAFSGERGRPAADLVERVLALAPPAFAPETIVDLGCGTGALLLSLGERWKEATLVGVDLSPEMLAEARRADRAGRARWVEADVGAWEPERDARPALLVSNACLHWVPDHARLVPRLVDAVAPGGVLAVQMPVNFDAPSHTIARALASEPPFAAHVTLAPPPVLSPSAYHRLLAASPDVEAIDVWETEYLHALRGDDPVVGWVRGTTLLPILAALEAADASGGEGLAARFLDAYRARVAAAYPREPDGTTLFPFKRLFFVLRKRTRR
jgi:trans-aconitate 2-methyltransferase